MQFPYPSQGSPRVFSANGRCRKGIAAQEISNTARISANFTPIRSKREIKAKRKVES
jgi:hypothetical protein